MVISRVFGSAFLGGWIRLFRGWSGVPSAGARRRAAMAPMAAVIRDHRKLMEALQGHGGHWVLDADMHPMTNIVGRLYRTEDRAVCLWYEAQVRQQSASQVDMKLLAEQTGQSVIDECKVNNDTTVVTVNRIGSDR